MITVSGVISKYGFLKDILSSGWKACWWRGVIQVSGRLLWS